MYLYIDGFLLSLFLVTKKISCYLVTHLDNNKKFQRKFQMKNALPSQYSLRNDLQYKQEINFEIMAVCLMRKKKST